MSSTTELKAEKAEVTETVLIIGAGASFEAGLPLGQDLKNDIRDILNIDMNESGRIVTGGGGSRYLANAINQLVKSHEDRFVESTKYVDACREIRGALPLANSIDGYLGSHSGNSYIANCGKMGIVEAILRAEEKSKLFVDLDRTYAELDLVRLESTWFARFFKKLASGNSLDHFVKRLSACCFVIFNYDRCVEHFLFHSIQKYYPVTAEKAGEILRAITFVHPYGKVGALPWEQKNGSVRFGEGESQWNLPVLSGQIRTVSEGIVLHADIELAKEAIAEARQLVFLGNAMHKPNLDIIRPDIPCSPKQMIATSHGIPKFEAEQKERLMSHFFVAEAEDIEIRFENLTCDQLFIEFGNLFLPE